MTVRTTIEAQLPELSTSARRIARLICERYPVSALGGIEDIARQAQVSPPTVTRFVRRLGFDRFADFQRAIRLEVQDADASPLALMERHRAAPSPGGTAAQSALIADLARSVGALDSAASAAAIEAATELIADRRRRISTLGGRWSSVAAQYIAFQLSSLRGEVHALTQPASGVREDRIADFTRRDVLIAYDFRRYAPETIGFCQAARQRGVGIVLFTDPDLSPIADIAEVTIPVAVATTSPLDTLVPALAASDMLLARLVEALGGEATRRMAMLETLRRRISDPAART
ncbi:MAG: MurR/RpiR family transcriptional regulator [Rhodobacteraceae bacterium]|jgi:DNA-binding MurR/RpiR family transcriptional regulator|nr:MurR/RpiR family transcriptional regulator [Paracoccaceae bacterium]